MKENENKVFAVIELENEDKLEDLKTKKKVVAVYYYGYPYYGYGYKYPYKYSEKSELEEVKCPVCNKTFDSYKEFLEHWEKEHKDKYGEYGEVKEESIDNVAKGEVKIAYNKKTKKYILMVGTGKKKLAWKIVGQYDTKEEAKEEAKKLSEELFELLESKECELLKEKPKCPVCGKEFDTYKEFIEHWNKEHKDEYGEYKTKEEKKELKEKTDIENEGEETLRRTRCPYCGELFESLNKHLPRCEERKKVLSELYKCNYCDKTFTSELDLIKHLEECSKYQMSREELSEKSTEEKTTEEKKEAKEEGEKETKESKEEEGKEKTTKEEEGIEKKEKEEESTEKKEQEKKEEEEKIVKEPPKRLSKEELLKTIKEAEGDIIDKAAELIIKRK